MRLQEIFLIETTEEDRAIVSLASSISDYLRKYEDSEDTEVIKVGTIGDLFDTPLTILDPIKIELDTHNGIMERMKKERPDEVAKENSEVIGIWYMHSKTVVFDKDYIDTYALKSIISHELRHALDDFKSGFKASTSKKYATPKDKANRKVTDDPYFGNVAYLAEPAEINARFLEVMNQMVTQIRIIFKMSPEKIGPAIMQTFRQALEHYQIADLFPQKEKSKDYKQLIKRGMDFIQKEIQHQESITGKKLSHSARHLP